jgi:ribosome recycling factor
MTTMVNDILEEAKQNMSKGLDALRRELTRIRTGRANLSLLDGIRVDYYGTPTPLNQVANLAIPDPRLITIKPWEKKMLVAITKAIQESDIGLTPATDSELIRLPIPPLTTERRKELVKQANRCGEDAKVAVRNARRDANEMLKEAEKSKEISEDDTKKGQELVQKETDAFIKKVDEILAAKAKEIEG